jgi:hypothetical protein
MKCFVDKIGQSGVKMKNIFPTPLSVRFCLRYEKRIERKRQIRKQTKLPMKTLITKTFTSLRIHLWAKRALFGAACGLGLLSTAAFGQVSQQLYIDCGATGTTVPTPAGFTKVNITSLTVGNYTFANVAGSAYTLTVTNAGAYSAGGTTCDKDGWYTGGGTPVQSAGFTLSGLPTGETVAIYANMGWDGSGSAAKFIYGGTTNQVIAQSVTAPSMSTLTYVGRAVVDVNGTVSAVWTGPAAGQGQVGALIFDIEPCQPVITVLGNNPMMVPINSTFVDPGATAVESCSGSALTVITNGTVDATTLGTYTNTYTAIADGITNSATRIVNVVLSDFLNLDLAESGDGTITPAGFNRLNYSGANMTFSEPSVGGTPYSVVFTNVSGTYQSGGTTIDRDGFYCNSGVTNGFYVTGLVPGSQVTLYACWAWDGANNAAVITWTGATNLLNVGTGITLPSPTTFMNCGIEVADGTGRVSGTWTGQSGHQGQIGGMIFGIQAPVAHNITILPAGVTNSCGSSATFVAAAPGGATYQWYDNFTNPITGATNITLVLTNLHPSASGNYNFIATATNASWSATNFAVVSIYDVAPPVLTMNGNTVVVVPLNSSWADPGVTAYDTCAGNYLTVTTNGTVNTSVVGQYNLTYSATTGDGVSATNDRSVIVFDPASTATEYSLYLDYGPVDVNDYYPIFPDGFTKLLFGNLYDNIYGNVSFPDPTGVGSGLTNIFTNIGSWNTGTDYTNTLSTDGFANHGGQPATFSLSGVPAGQVVKVYAVYGWGGAAQGPQIIYGGATNIVNTGITVNSPQYPTELNFQYVGSAIATNGVVTGTFYGLGGPTTEGQIGAMIYDVQNIATHSIVISPATSVPQCGSNVTFTASPSGLGPFTYQWYDNNTNLIAGATNATYTLVNVHPSSEGNYTVIAGNAYTSATNYTTVTGVFDSQAPIMALSGPSTVNIVVNSTYVDAGASAYDLCAQAPLAMTTNSTVDTTTIGSYTVTYSAVTASSTPGSIVRTVNVTAVPNLSLNLDFASMDGAVPPAPVGFTLLQSAVNLAAVANYSWPNVAGSIYTLSISNMSQYNTANTNEPLTTCGFYKNAGNNYPATFTMSGLQPTLKVTCYAIHAWDGAAHYADVYFGGTHAIDAGHGDPGQNPTITNFTRIGATIADSTGVVSGYWQGSTGGETNAEGQVGGMVFVIGTNTPPVAYPITMVATNGVPSTTNVFSGAWIPTDADSDPLTVTAVQSSTAHGGTASTDGTNLTYLNSTGYNGSDTFTYVVGDGFGGFSTNTATVSVTTGTVNQPPVAGPQVMGAVSGQAATLKIIGGTNPPTDLDGDTLTITTVTTPANGTASTDGTNVTYTSANGFTGSDTFNYVVGDGQGAFATNTVTVSVVPATSYNKLAAPVRSGGNYNVSFNGIPYDYYVLLTATNLAPPVTWSPVVTNQADGNSGVITFSFTPSAGKGFYKVGSLP